MWFLAKKKKVAIIYGSDVPEQEENIITWLIPDVTGKERKNRFETIWKYLEKKYSLELLDVKKLIDHKKLLKKIKVIILVDSIVFSEDKLRVLEAFLVGGGTIFSAFPSLWSDGEDTKYDSLEKCPVLNSRLKHFFSTEQEATFAEIKGQFGKSGMEDLLNHIPREINYEGKALLIGSTNSVGYLSVETAKNPVTSQQIQTQRYGFSPILKRYYDNGGLLIYVTFDYFQIFMKTGLGNLIDNVIKYSMKERQYDYHSTTVKDVSREEFVKLKAWVFFSYLLILSIIIFMILALSRPQDFLSIVGNLGLSLIPPSLFALVKYGISLRKRK